VAWQGRVAAAGQEAEAVGQPLEDLVCAQDAGAHRSQLDSQRQAVQAPAHVDDGHAVAVAELELTRRGGRPLHEERHRLVLRERRQRLSAVGWRQLEGRDREDVLARCRERLPARGDDPHSRRGAHQFGGEPRRRLEKVLAVVEHHQQLPLSRMRKEHRHRLGTGLVAEVAGGEHHVWDERGIAHLGQLDPPRAVAKTPCQVVHRPEGQARLAHAAGADQADQPGGRQLAAQLRKLAAAADEAGDLGRHVAGSAGGPGHARPNLLRPHAPARPGTGFGNSTDSRAVMAA
jgi:hypothetical protein